MQLLTLLNQVTMNPQGQNIAILRRTGAMSLSQAMLLRENQVQTTSFNRDQTYHRTTAPVVKSRVGTRTDTSWDSNARSVFDTHHRCLRTHILGQTTICNTQAAVNLIFSGWYYPPAQPPWMMPIYSYGQLQCYGPSTPWPMQMTPVKTVWIHALLKLLITQSD